MINWINFLHIYQPPTQDVGMLKKVVDESYLRIIGLLRDYPNLKLTLNISGSLLEQLRDNNYNEIIDGFKKYVTEGRIELTASAMYHPILSLLSKEEIERQLELHNNISREIFGSFYNPRGFFIPEMAYSKKVASVIKKMGITWILLDEIHFPAGKPDSEIKYKIKPSNLVAVFRNRKYSRSFSPETIITDLSSIKEKYLITAHDGEMYGHWHRDDREYYKKVFTHPNIKTMTVSEYVKDLEKTEEVIPREASWESTDDDLVKKVPYPFWNNPENKIHQMLWKFARLAIKTVRKYRDDTNYKAARHHLDRGLSSCSWWWATDRKPDVLSPLTWNPTEIEKGAKELLTSIRSIESIDSSIKIKAEKMFSRLRDYVWQKHWVRVKK